MIVESYEDVIVLSGALRSNFWETVHTAIALTLKRHPSGVIIDCSGLTEATPQGADTFRDIMDYIRSHDARVIVAAVPEPVFEVIRSVPEVRSQLAVAKSVEAARRSLDLLLEGEDAKPKKRRGLATNGGAKVVVCIMGDRCDEQALRLGSEIADSAPTELHLVYVVLVPRDLPLQAPMAKEEEAAATSIEKGRAFLKEKNVNHVAHLERGRDIASTVEDLVQEVKASRVIIGLSSSPKDGENTGKLVRSLLSKVTKELIFVRGNC